MRFGKTKLVPSSHIAPGEKQYIVLRGVNKALYEKYAADGFDQDDLKAWVGQTPKQPVDSTPTGHVRYEVYESEDTSRSDDSYRKGVAPDPHPDEDAGSEAGSAISVVTLTDSQLEARESAKEKMRRAMRRLRGMINIFKVWRLHH